MPHLRASAVTTIAVAALAWPAAGQDVAAPRDPATVGDDFVVPLHRSADESGTDDLWAAGPDYKVRFAARPDAPAMEFFPVLGATAPRNLPFAWRTDAITHGGADRLAPTWKRRIADPRRVEIDRGTVVERYDVRADGVYQSFVMARRPAGDGDLEIRGKVATDLVGDPRGDRHAPLAFRDAEGQEIVRYGAAEAIDAVGRRLPIGTSFDGASIALTVPDAWLDTAAWPVTIDPLTSRNSVIFSTQDLADPVVTRDDLGNRRLIVHRRASSQTDWDAFGRLVEDDFTPVGTIFSDVSSTVSVEAVDVGFAGYLGGHWIIATELETSLSRFVRLYRHPTNVSTINAGTSQSIPRPVGTHDSAPKVGGSVAGNLALIAFERDLAKDGSDETKVMLTVLDASNGTLTPRREANDVSQTSYDAEAASVSYRGSGSDDQWVVAWQERSNAFPNDDWDIQINRVALDGTTDGMRTVTTDVPVNRHALAPQLAGERGNFGIAYVSRDNTGPNSAESGDRLVFRAFTWPSTQAAPSVRNEREVATENLTVLRLSRAARALAFDRRTDSHFALCYERTTFLFQGFDHEYRAARLAWNGVALEEQVVESHASVIAEYTPISVWFDDDAQTFAMTYAERDANTIARLFGRDLEHPAASATTYGLACQGSIQFVNNGSLVPPRAGSRFTTIRLDGGSAGFPTWLFASIAPANAPMPIGGNGCRLLLDTQLPLITVGNWITPANGSVGVDLELPPSTAGADVYWQFVQLVGPTLRSSNGLHTAIR